MVSAARKRTIIGVVGLTIVIAGGGIYAWRVAQPVHGKIHGKILGIDPHTRTASLEYVHPRTGETYELKGEVASDCDIQIDGQPARLEDLNVGEEVEAQGLVYRTGRVIAQQVRVTRAGPPPASQPEAPLGSRPASGTESGS